MSCAAAGLDAPVLAVGMDPPAKRRRGLDGAAAEPVDDAAARARDLAELSAWEPSAPPAELPPHFAFVEDLGLDDRLLDALMDELCERLRAQPRASFMGSERPRSELWFSTNDRPYTYSRRTLPSHAVGPALAVLFERANDWLAGWCNANGVPPQAYNGVLANGYFRRTDSVAPHSDDEPTIDQRYPILSISVGNSWTFTVRLLKRPSAETFAQQLERARPEDRDAMVALWEAWPAPQPLVRMVLRSGDALVMLPGAQTYYSHEVEKRMPKRLTVERARELGALDCPMRINLTFRVYRPAP